MQDPIPTQNLNVLAQTYEEIPYLFYAHPESYLGRVEFLAQLFGLPCALQRGARILEIGCATGGNLIPMAYRFPESTFVGVDLARGQIEQATRDSQRLNLSNVSFVQGSFEQLTLDGGAFDYIIAHGVFSWLPAGMQRTLLQTMRQRLTTRGIGYVSFNTYPGWASRMAVRQMLRFHLAPHAAAPFAEQIERSQQLLTAVSAQLPAHGSTWRITCERVLEELHHAPQSYIAHDLLETENHPCFFVEFNALLQEAGLRYLCDTHLSGLDGIGLSRPTRDFIGQQAGADQIAREQYFDFMVDRAYRAVLVSSVDAPVRKTITEDALPPSFFVVGRVLTQDGQLTHRDTAAVVTFDEPYGRRVLEYLGSIFPAAASVQEIEQQLPLEGKSGGELRRYLLGLMLHLFARRLVDLSTTAPTHGIECANQTHPQVARLMRYFAAQQERVPNLRHATVTLTAEIREFVARLDGRTDPAQLWRELRNSRSGARDEQVSKDSAQEVASLLSELQRLEILTHRN